MEQVTARGRRAAQEELVFLALGGLGEIGMNVYAYGLGPPDARTWLMVDLGITFPRENEPGVDIVLPDVRYISEDVGRLAGIVLTHAHEDHFGAVVELWPRLRAPVYATPFTAALLKAKLAEFGTRLEIPIHIIPLGARFKVGPFDLELVTMAHSIPEPNGVVIRAGGTRVFHTGDWKIDQTPLLGDPTDVARIEALGQEGVDVLVCDSTNAFRDGRSPSERDVARSLTEIIKRARRRVAVTTFASNVARIRAVADAARATGRRLVVCGRALHRVIAVAKETGYLPGGMPVLDQQDFKHIPREEVLALCTGSQGEPRAALARIAEETHPDVAFDAGDMVIFSSRTIPGNEVPVATIHNNLSRIGCEVITDQDALVHVTGHPRREELKQMYAWVKPTISIPMHGEARHLAEHARLARAAGVPEVLTPTDGEIVRLAPGPAQVVDEAPVGRLYRDGRLIVLSDEGPVRERRKLAHVGIVVVSIVLSRKGEVVAAPDTVLDGVPEDGIDGRPMEDVVLDAVDGTLRSIPRERRRSPELVEEAVQRAVRAAVAQMWGKKPICKVMVSQVDGKG